MEASGSDFKTCRKMEASGKMEAGGKMKTCGKTQAWRETEAGGKIYNIAVVNGGSQERLWPAGKWRQEGKWRQVEKCRQVEK